MTPAGGNIYDCHFPKDKTKQNKNNNKTKLCLLFSGKDRNHFFRVLGLAPLVPAEPTTLGHTADMAPDIP